jgi:HPt (histidine-containing phosphotransfer) domain-containing protein
MDGLEASRAICDRYAPHERPRIIAMTAEAMGGDRERCLAAGMDDYITKPVALDRLAEALCRCRPVSREVVIDRGVLDQLREDLGETAALRQVIETFLDRTPGVLTALRDAAVRGDDGAVRRAAHTIKGTSSILGARALSEQCAEIEHLGREGSVPNAAARVSAIEASYRRTEGLLRAEVARLGGPMP